MNIRWTWLVVLAGAVTARGEDGAGADSGEDFDEDASLSLEESRGVRPRQYPTPPAANYPPPTSYNALPAAGFRPSPAAPAPLALLAGYSRPSPASAADAPRAPHRKAPPPDKESSAESSEREEPDRLALLLQQSRFQCAGRPGGYYADEELACEVFHYCQDNVRHSWICPDGFTFHQVHLICMPPTHDNICEKSAKYHFVNEYLYRPVNEEEVQRRPNVSLKYGDRYYPSEVFHDDRYQDDAEDRDERDDGPHAPPPHQRQPAPYRHPAQQVVFRSPAEVDIPLAQRRPPLHY